MPPQANVKAEGNATEEAVEPVTKSSSDADISAGVPKKKMQTLAERNRIPPSFFLTSLIILMFQYYGGIYRMDTIYSWKSSIVTSYFTSIDKMRGDNRRFPRVNSVHSVDSTIVLKHKNN